MEESRIKRYFLNPGNREEVKGEDQGEAVYREAVKRRIVKTKNEDLNVRR